MIYAQASNAQQPQSKSCTFTKRHRIEDTRTLSATTSADRQQHTTSQSVSHASRLISGESINFGAQPRNG